jgi:hypothetical protein
MHKQIRYSLTQLAATVALLAGLAAGLAPANATTMVQAAPSTSQADAQMPLMLAATDGMERRQDRRANRQDCRQEEGLVGKDKRDCKQEGRAGDPAEEVGETGKPEETGQPEQTDKD